MSDGIEVDFKEFGPFYERLMNDFSRHSPHAFWGDRIDGRFLALYTVRKFKNKRILDLGCCTGMTLSELDPSNEKFGLEISRDYLTLARKINKKTRFVRADMLRLPYKDASFDCVIAFAMLATPEWDQKANFINEVSRVLRKGGELVITTPNRNYLSRINKIKCVDYERLKGYLEKDFECQIYGFNPIPSFPYFLPNSIISGIPGIWKFLVDLMNKSFLVRYCRSFIALAKKK